MFKIFKKISNKILGISNKFYSTIPTCQRYPHIKKYDFNVVGPKDLEYFNKILSNEQILIDENLIDYYNTDWLKECKGASKLVLRPKTSEQISNILKYCNANKLPVVPQGGNTGLVHGSIPVFDEIILSLSLMNHIESIDTLSGILVCQSGCILKQINDHIGEKGFIVPLDLGSKGSCQIGGNLSTNAGGIRLIRYGPLRGSILGIEAVLADGSVLDCMNTMRKDNTGYDLKQLFIGSEGTLGVITKVALQCQPKPSDMNVAFFGCDDFGSIIKAYSMARQTLGETLSAFEFMDKGAMTSVVSNLHYYLPAQLRTDGSSEGPLHNFYYLVENSGTNVAHDTQKMMDFCQRVSETMNHDCVLASNLDQGDKLWRYRESITLSLLSDGYVYKYDLSLPLTFMDELVGIMRQRLDDSGARYTRIVGYGHVGDGNLHLNITSPSYDPTLLSLIEPFVYDRVCLNYGGSISAEHGLGLVKQKFGHYGKSGVGLGLAKELKLMLDPNSILNPYKVLNNQP